MSININGDRFILFSFVSFLPGDSPGFRHPPNDAPAMQYLDTVDKGSVADKAGLKGGDFILEVCTFFLFFFFPILLIFFEYALFPVTLGGKY